MPRRKWGQATTRFDRRRIQVATLCEARFENRFRRRGWQDLAISLVSGNIGSLARLKRLLTYAARAIRRKLFTQAVKIGLSKRATWNKPHAQKLTRTAIRKSNSFKIISLF